MIQSIEIQVGEELAVRLPIEVSRRRSKGVNRSSPGKYSSTVLGLAVDDTVRQVEVRAQACAGAGQP
jgi:hypothetical protein